MMLNKVINSYRLPKGMEFYDCDGTKAFKIKDKNVFTNKYIAYLVSNIDNKEFYKFGIEFPYNSTKKFAVKKLTWAVSEFKDSLKRSKAIKVNWNNGDLGLEG